MFFKPAVPWRSITKANCVVRTYGEMTDFSWEMATNYLLCEGDQRAKAVGPSFPCNKSSTAGETHAVVCGSTHLDVSLTPPLPASNPGITTAPCLLDPYLDGGALASYRLMHQPIQPTVCGLWVGVSGARVCDMVSWESSARWSKRRWENGDESEW